ncbi:MAG: methylenetetrahydrofolate reductase [NAD(P)H] [Hyphomicrobiales bacterium]
MADGTKPPLSVSFEFFPPRDTEAANALSGTITKLKAFRPDFVSVTYGAGGSTQDASLASVDRLVNEFALPTCAHLTCVGKTKAEVDAVALDFARRGVKHFLALRGDPPAGERRFEPHPGGYRNAADLVEGLAKLGDFEISVAAYPEKHPESFTFEVDLAMLTAKVEAGATRAITQFFFDNSAYFRFVDRVRARGINIPIVPGILPVTNLEKVAGFAQRCGAHLTADFARRFEGLENDPEERKLVAAAVAAEQVAKLHDAGVTSFHFYTLNRADVTGALCRMLGLSAEPRSAAA